MHQPDFFCVGVTGLEPAASSSRTTRATNCATPRCLPLIAGESPHHQLLKVPTFTSAGHLFQAPQK